MLCVLANGLSTRDLHDSYLNDDSYAHLSVAWQVASDGGFCLVDGQRIPLTRDALWQVLLAGLICIFRNDQGMLFLLGALCAVATSLVVLRLARLMFPFPSFVVFSACAVVVAPGFLLPVLGGSSLILGMLLVTSATLLHIEALQGRRTVLPLAAALLIGLSACLRIESALWWLVFTLHAALYTFWAKGRFSLGEVLLKSLSGFMMIAVCLFPLVAWNVNFFSVPWPQIPEATLTANVWSQWHPAAVVQAGLKASAGAVGPTFGTWSQLPYLNSFVGWLALLFGALVLLSIGFLRDEEKPYSIIPFSLLALPGLALMVAPYTGMSSFAWVFGTALPMLVLLSVFGLFRIPFFIEELYRRWKEGLPSAFGFRIWWCASCSLFALWLLLSSFRVTQEYYNCLTNREDQRHAVAVEWVLLDDTDVLATDQPGWAARMLRPGHVIDLRGWYSPEWLALQDDDYSRNLFLAQREVSWILRQGEDGFDLKRPSYVDATP